MGANRPRSGHGTTSRLQHAGRASSGRSGHVVPFPCCGRAGVPEPTPPAASAPMKSSHQDLAERLRKLEAINQSIINRLDQSERERRRSEERYRSLEAEVRETSGSGWSRTRRCRCRPIRLPRLITRDAIRPRKERPRSAVTASLADSLIPSAADEVEERPLAGGSRRRIHIQVAMTMNISFGSACWTRRISRTSFRTTRFRPRADCTSPASAFTSKASSPSSFSTRCQFSGAWTGCGICSTAT